MQDGLEAATFIGIVKNTLTQPVAVNPAVFIQDRVAKNTDNFVNCLLTGFGQGACNFICIDHRHTAHPEKRRDSGFTTANATGQADA